MCRAAIDSLVCPEHPHKGDRYVFKAATRNHGASRDNGQSTLRNARKPAPPYWRRNYKAHSDTEIENATAASRYVTIPPTMACKKKKGRMPEKGGEKEYTGRHPTK